MASKTYGNLMKAAFNKEIDWDTDTIKVMLLSSSYSPNQDVHDYLDDVKSFEVSGTGYTAGGKAVTNKTVTYDAGSNITKFDCDDVTWTASTITARYAVFYSDAGATDGQKVLISYHDFGSDRASSNGEYVIRISADGVFTTSAG